MARVPVYGPRKATLDPIQRQFYQANTSPEAHGAGIGRALQHVASGLNSFADGLAAQEALDDQAVVNDAMNQFRTEVREQSYNPDSGFFMKNGEDAVRGRLDYQDNIEKRRQEIGSKLNAKQRKIYDRQSNQRKHSAYDSAIKHSANQRKAWYNENSKATLQSLADDALAFSNEQDKFEGVIAEGERHLDEQGQLNAWSKEQLEHYKEQWRSQVHSNIVKKLAGEDAEVAQQWLYKYGGYMSEADKTNLYNMLDDPVREQQAEREADRILRGEEAADEEPETMDHQGHKIEVIKPKYGQADELHKPAEDRVNDDAKGPKVDDSIVKRSKKTSSLRTSERGMQHVFAKEGLRLEAYLDPVGVPTIGYGHTKGVKLGQKITREQALKFAREDIGVAERAVANHVKIKLNQDQYDALVSFTFNLGEGNLKKIAGDINAGNFERVAKRMRQFNKARSRRTGALRTLPGLVTRRNAEANMFLSKAGPKQFVGSPMHVQSELDKIKDPKLRAATEKRINAKINLQNKVDRARQRRAKIAAEKLIITNPNLKPTQLPLEIQAEIGIEGMTALKNYSDKQGLITTDEGTYLDLIKQQAEDPTDFANNVDLLDYIDKLSKQDMRELAKMQAATLKDEREGKQKALTESRSLNTAMSIAKLRLEETGVIKKAKNRKAEDIKREARFQRALAERMREFQKIESRLPSDLEISDMVDQLLTPIIIVDPATARGAPSGLNFMLDMFDGSTEEGLLFEAPYRKDGSEVKLNVPYENIPTEVRAAIREQLTRELKREPTQDEIIKDYVDFVLTGK